MTAPRLTEVECPECLGKKWIIDGDYRGADIAGGVELVYPERSYACADCGRHGPGWSVRQQAPPAFLLQPHDLYPITQADFDHWVAILRTNFPDHPRLAELGSSFFPRTPEDTALAQTEWEREHPVREMRDQDGARRVDPEIFHAAEWLDLMRPGDSLSFLRRDGGLLEISGPAGETFLLRCVDDCGHVVLEAADLDSRTLLDVVGRYLAGKEITHAREIDEADRDVPVWPRKRTVED